MLATLTVLFLLTAISFAVVVMTMTLRESWGKVMAALMPVYANQARLGTAPRIKRITRRPASFQVASPAVRAAA